MAKHIMIAVVSVVLLLAPRFATAEGKRLVVVVAKGSSVTDLKHNDLKRAFLGDPINVGGKTLVPFNASPNSRDRAAFDRSILGMSPDQVGRFWIDRKVRGQGAAPRSLPSSVHIAKVVAKFPNGISYVPADQLNSALQPVKLDGIAYTDQSYPIVLPPDP